MPDAEKREQGKVYSKTFILTPECGVALQFINAVLYIYIKNFECLQLKFPYFCNSSATNLHISWNLQI